VTKILMMGTSGDTLMSVTAINVSGMSVTVNTEEGGHGSMGAGQSRAAAGSGSGSLRKARIRPDTAAQIAARAGRQSALLPHLAGKREELFGGSASSKGKSRPGGRGAPGGRPARRCCLGLAAAITMLGEFRRDLSASDTPSSRQPGAGSRSWRNWPTQPSRHRPMAR